MTEEMFRAPSSSRSESEGMNRYSVGQKVVISQWRREAVQFEDGEVAKVGRKWITVKIGEWREERFDLNGRSDRDWGHPPRLWPDRVTYEAEILRRQAWDRFYSKVRSLNHPPAHLTTEQIEAMIAALAEIPPSQLGAKGHP